MAVKWQVFTVAELPHVLEFVGTCYRDKNFTGTHPGDVTHHLSNGMRGQNIEAGLRLFKVEGEIQAIMIIENVELRIFTPILHPKLWGTPTADELYAAAEQLMLELSPVTTIENPDEPPVYWTTTYDNQPQQSELLTARGYKLGEEEFMVLTLRDLTAIPAVTLPDGYTIRGTTESDVEQLCAVHSGSFGSNWTVPEYLSVMRTPGFDPARERVVVAPDGRFAAFCIYWADPISKVGEFEPVGCHEDFQRKGLTRALMYDTMHILRDLGMTRAMVVHQAESANPASAGLYRAAGFQRHCGIFDAQKPV